ncbi:MAG: DUF4123 domain-containing protein [Polyangiaceae bacterium]
MTPRRAILSAKVGPPGARRVLLAPGQRLKVGRTSLSDLQIPEDDSLSQEHFEITWDGETCRIQDLGTPGGTLLGGQRKDTGTVRSGGWIRAGGTDFMVHFEDLSAPAISHAEPAAAHAALETTRAQTPLFAVLDAARTDRIPRLLATSADEHISLYDGLRAEIEADVAPYLVRIAEGSLLLPRLCAEGWGQSWGIFLAADLPLREVRAHLRRLLVVTREKDDRPMYFRFYDPRVLRSFLPIATARQRSAFFGPIARIFAEDPEAGALSVFS